MRRLPPPGPGHNGPPHEDDWEERYRLTLEEALKAEALVTRLEHKRKSVLSALVKGIGGPVAKAEHLARAHPTYESACDDLYEAELDAAVKRAKADAMKEGHERWRTMRADRREEIRSFRG